MTARALAILFFGVSVVLFGQWLVSCSEVAELRDQVALQRKLAKKQALELNEAAKEEMEHGMQERMERLDDWDDELLDHVLPDGVRKALRSPAGRTAGTDSPPGPE